MKQIYSQTNSPSLPFVVKSPNFFGRLFAMVFGMTRLAEITADGMRWQNYPFIPWRDIQDIRFLPPKTVRYNEAPMGGIVLRDLASFSQQLNGRQRDWVHNISQLFGVQFFFNEHTLNMPVDESVAWLNSLRQTYGTAP